MLPEHKIKGTYKNSIYIDGKEIFSSVKTKISQTAYPSAKNFLNERRNPDRTGFET